LLIWTFNLPQKILHLSSGYVAVMEHWVSFTIISVDVFVRVKMDVQLVERLIVAEWDIKM